MRFPNNDKKRKRDDDGAEYEEMEGTRETGDGEGDKIYILGKGCLTPEEIAKMRDEE